ATSLPFSVDRLLRLVLDTASLASGSCIWREESAMKSSATHIDTQTRNRRRRIGWLSLTGLRRCLFYKPLAILMSILMLPAVSWMEGGGAGLLAFQSGGPIISGRSADTTSKSIIRKYCVNGVDYGPDLVQLEKDAVDSYLAYHGPLPPSDAHVIYELGRSDLRSAIRANMLAILLGIINKAPTSRTDHEQNLYNRLSTIVQQNEIALYTNAINEFRRWQSDPC